MEQFMMASTTTSPPERGVDLSSLFFFFTGQLLLSSIKSGLSVIFLKFLSQTTKVRPGIATHRLPRLEELDDPPAKSCCVRHYYARALLRRMNKPTVKGI